MRDFAGEPTFPIWLIGDSPPDEGADKLDTPLDPRHPARHSIWTSVADPMQDRLYRQKKLRLDTSRLYIRNAMSQRLEAGNISEQSHRWREELKILLDLHKPKIVLTFGTDALEWPCSPLVTHTNYSSRQIRIKQLFLAKSSEAASRNMTMTRSISFPFYMFLLP